MAETSTPAEPGRYEHEKDPVVDALLAATGGIMTLVAVAAALAAFDAAPGLGALAMAATTGVLVARTGNRYACVAVVLAAAGLFLVVLAGPGRAAWPGAVLLVLAALLGRARRWLRPDGPPL